MTEDTGSVTYTSVGCPAAPKTCEGIKTGSKCGTFKSDTADVLTCVKAELCGKKIYCNIRLLLKENSAWDNVVTIKAWDNNVTDIEF